LFLFTEDAERLPARRAYEGSTDSGPGIFCAASPARRSASSEPTGDPPLRAVPRDEERGDPKDRPTGEKRTFHSPRHTFVYGHFEKATRRREAEAMAGVLGV